MPDEENGSVKIGLKDVWSQVNAVEKTMSDAFQSLQLTMSKIMNHLEQVDSRNQAADQIHKEHSERIRKLEDSRLSQATLDVYKRRSTAAIWTAIGSGAAAVGAAIGIATHLH